MNDYERIANIIRFLDASQPQQPRLATLATRAGLSQFHFHRLFSRWAGVTPKEFLQSLTVAHAKHLLREGKSVLDAAYGAGLSGPGRLHDLCVTLEAATPGELKSGGAGWTISYGFATSPFGRILVGESPRGICQLAFVEAGEETASIAALQGDWPQAKFKRADSVACRVARQVFVQPVVGGAKGNLRAFVRGTPFQVRVWRALLEVQPGTLVCYGQLAGAAGRPAAARAVGTAVGQNRLAYLIPCHRVIRETGVFGHYRWGPVRKRAIVAWESSSGPQPAGAAPPRDKFPLPASGFPEKFERATTRQKPWRLSRRND